MVHDFLAKFKHFKSSNLHALKGNRGLNSSMLAFREEPNHRQGSEATDPLGLLTVNCIAKDTHLNRGIGWSKGDHWCFQDSWKHQLLKISCISVTNSQMAPLIVDVAHVAAWWCLDSDSETIRQVTSDQIPSNPFVQMYRAWRCSRAFWQLENASATHDGTTFLINHGERKIGRDRPTPRN